MTITFQVKSPKRLNFVLCKILVVSLSLLKSERQLNCPVHDNTVQLYCTPPGPRSLHGPESSIRPTTPSVLQLLQQDVFFNSSIVCLRKYRVFIAAFIQTIVYCGKYDKTFSNQLEYYLWNYHEDWKRSIDRDMKSKNGVRLKTMLMDF